jgi:tRNA1(Val) A37 N6-methylase TrmN6
MFILLSFQQTAHKYMPVETTEDTFFSGRLLLRQPIRGYRSSVDSILLAYFAYTGRGAERCIDLGAGCGTVGLSLLLSGHVGVVTAIECQPELADTSLQNAILNGLEDKFEMIRADIRGQEMFIHLAHNANLVVINPPFWPLTHRLPTSEQRRIACHEINGTLDDWVEAASLLLSRRKGRVCIVYPSKRLDELLYALQKKKLSPSRLRFVHPCLRKPAELVLIEARSVSKGNLTILPPLFLRDEDGCDSKELSKIVTGQFSDEITNLPDLRRQ